MSARRTSGTPWRALHAEYRYADPTADADRLVTDWGCESRVPRGHRRRRDRAPLGVRALAFGVAGAIGALLGGLGAVSAATWATPDAAAWLPAGTRQATDTALPATAGTAAPETGDAERRAQEVAARASRGVQRRAPTRWVDPLPGGRVTSCYGPRWGRLHRGIDVAAAYGARIRSVSAGIVVQAGWRYSGYGYSVTVDHGGGHLTFYAHASRVLVEVGRRVAAGTAVALVGSTGHSFGPHLHIGAAVARESGDLVDWFVNPAPLLRSRGVHLAGCT